MSPLATPYTVHPCISRMLVNRKFTPPFLAGHDTLFATTSAASSVFSARASVLPYLVPPSGPPTCSTLISIRQKVSCSHDKVGQAVSIDGEAYGREPRE